MFIKIIQLYYLLIKTNMTRIEKVAEFAKETHKNQVKKYDVRGFHTNLPIDSS